MTSAHHSPASHLVGWLAAFGLVLFLTPSSSAFQYPQPNLDALNAFAAASAGVSPPLPIAVNNQLPAHAKKVGAKPGSPEHIEVNLSKIKREFKLSEYESISAVLEALIYHEYLHKIGLGSQNWDFNSNCCANQLTCEHLAIHMASLNYMCEEAEIIMLSCPEGGWEDAVDEICETIKAYRDSMTQVTGRFYTWLTDCYAWQSSQSPPHSYPSPLEPLPNPGVSSEWPPCDICP